MRLRAAEGDPLVKLNLYVPYGGLPPSVNEAIRTRGQLYSKTMEDWKVNAKVAALDAVRSLHLARPLPPAVIRVTCPMPTNVTRDPHNYTGTLCKSIIDGLVAARFWASDSTGYVTVVDPKLVYMPELKDPATRVRANALVEIIPVETLQAALAGHPVLDGLFDTE